MPIVLAPPALEAALLREVERRRRPDPLAPLWIVAPTRRLLDHLAVRIAQQFGAVANLRFLHHRALAAEVVRRAGGTPLRPLPPSAALWLFEREIARETSDLARYLQREPAAVAPLLATFRDLRDAGVQSDAARAPRRLSSRADETLALFRRFESLLDELAPQGVGDGARIAADAVTATATAELASIGLIHYGAYELIGVHQRLVDTLATRVDTAFFEPRATDLPPIAPRRTLTSLAGAREEVRFGLRRLLAWHVDGVARFDEMALLVRSKTSHARALAAESTLLGVDLDSSCPTALAGIAAATRLRPLLDAAAMPGRRALEKRADECGATPPHFDGDGFEALIAGWHGAVQALASAPLTHWFEELAATLRPLAGRLDARVRDHGGAARLARLLAAELSAAPLADGKAPRGALRVLDFHQARAIPFRRAWLAGLNDRQVPRRAVEDFFLPDSDRDALRAAAGVPIPRRRDALRDEERLFDVVVGAVTEELVVSFARSGDSGRDAAPSPFLRRLGLDARAADLVPRHPWREFARLRDGDRLLTRHEALALAADADPAAARTLAGGGDYSHCLDFIAAIDDFSPRCLDFDGVGVPVAAKEHWTPTELEALGECPLAYWFGHELGIEPRDETPDGELAPRERGGALHRVLHRFYAAALPTDRPPDPAAIVAAASAEIGPLLEAELGATARRTLLPALAELRIAALRDDLIGFITADVARMARLGLRAGRFEFEMGTARLDLPTGPLPLSLKLDRLLVDADGGEWIGDYKSSKCSSLKKRVGAKQLLAGLSLQLPIYALARQSAGGRVTGLELLGLAPETKRDARHDPRAVELDVELLTRERESFRTLLTDLTELRAAGSFPIRPDADREHSQCGRCDFRNGCRQLHAPTRERVSRAEPFAKFYERSGLPADLDDDDSDGGGT